jgi:O-methyltransferase
MCKHSLDGAEMLGLGLGKLATNAIKRRQMRNIYLQVKDYTMLSEPVFCDNLMLADMVRNVSGCVVECGVWRGGMSAGLCRLLGNEREYYLFDSFEGLPPAQPIDGAAAIRWQQDTKSDQYYDNCSAPPEFAQRAMELVGAKRYKLCPGFFDKTLPAFKPTPIALLRLDADWYDSTMICLDNLFDHVSNNGQVIIDDYYTWDGCSRALHDFLSKRKAPERIHSFNGSVCYLMKRGPQ